MKDLLRRAELESHVDGKLRAHAFSLSNGSNVEVLAQSETSIRGTRVQRISCDEVDLFTPLLFDAAQLVTRSATCDGHHIHGSVVCLSTLHRPNGVMTRLSADAAGGSRTLFKWSVVDSLERCPSSRACTPDTPNPTTKAIPLPVLDTPPADACPLYKDCQVARQTHQARRFRPLLHPRRHHPQIPRQHRHMESRNALPGCLTRRCCLRTLPRQHPRRRSHSLLPLTVSDRVRELYQRGLLMGNDPNGFSKVGDCHSTNPYFLADYDLGPGVYQLGEYAYLEPTIEYFQGSFGRTSLAAKKGLSTAGVLAPLWSDWKQCSSNESPLDCDFRTHQPSFAIISLGTNEAFDVKKDKSTFAGRLRRIIEHFIDHGVVPILSTKADNDEGDHYINYVTAKLALEYELPLWNFWRAVQNIPQQGMRSADHLTFAPTSSYTDFSKPENLEYGMQVRNLTALQVLDVVRREVTQTAVVATETPPTVPTPTVSVVHQAGETMVSPADGMGRIAANLERGFEALNEMVYRRPPDARGAPVRDDSDDPASDGGASRKDLSRGAGR